MATRSLGVVPRPALTLLALGLVAQGLVHLAAPPPQARAEALAAPPGLAALRVMSLGEPMALAKLLMLWLQAYDNQPGISIPFRDLDYDRVEAWLENILALDPNAQYPLLSASRLYGEVPDLAKQRSMLEFVYREFLLDPDRRWPWLAHCVILAKHRQKDLPLALKYARAIRERASAPSVPHWARQMEIFVLEDLNELESAKVILGGLIDSGQIKDPRELRFLAGKLESLDRRLAQRRPETKPHP
jgi:hypothetical protein